LKEIKKKGRVVRLSLDTSVSLPDQFSIIYLRFWFYFRCLYFSYETGICLARLLQEKS